MQEPTKLHAKMCFVGSLCPENKGVYPAYRIGGVQKWIFFMQ